jgi:hypothetical protein
MTITTTTGVLPAPFADLEAHSDWILETETERYGKRLRTPMTEMQAFYDAVFPRLREATEYCDEFPIDDLPDDVKRLMYLLFSLVEISFPVEVWRQARVPDSGAAAVECWREPSL